MTPSAAVAPTPSRRLLARPDEGDALEALRRQIDGIFREHRTARLAGGDGESTDIPAWAFHALRLVVQALARSQTMTLLPHGKELTTQEAADLPHVSQPHLVRLLDEGVIDQYKLGSHRRDVLLGQAEGVCELLRRHFARSQLLDQSQPHHLTEDAQPVSDAHQHPSVISALSPITNGAHLSLRVPLVLVRANAIGAVYT